MIGHRVVLRPRELAETADLAAALIRRHWTAFAKLLPWTVVPALFVFAADTWFHFGFGASLVLVAMATGLGSGAYVVLCGDLMLDPDAKVGSIQRRFLGRIVPFVLARLLASIVTTASIGFAFANAAFVPEGALLERGSPTQALSRSGALMRSVTGRAFGFGFLVCVVFVIGAVGGELFRYYARELFGLSNSRVTFFDGALGWSSLVGIALVVPYLETVRFLLYIDARTRREGWDLQVQLNALADLDERRTRTSSEAA